MRLAECKLELHPEKTKIVYCKDDQRRGIYLNGSFDFLGYTFRTRRSRNSRDGSLFMNFSPAISNKASKKIKDKIREWRLDKRTNMSLEDLVTNRHFLGRLKGCVHWRETACLDKIAVVDPFYFHRQSRLNPEFPIKRSFFY